MKKIISIAMVMTIVLSLFTMTASAAEYKTGNVVDYGKSCGYTTVYLTKNSSSSFKVYAYSSYGNEVKSSDTLCVKVADNSGKILDTYSSVKSGKSISLNKTPGVYRIYITKSQWHTIWGGSKNKDRVSYWSIKLSSGATFDYYKSYAKKELDKYGIGGKDNPSTSNNKTSLSTTTDSSKLYEGVAYYISPKHASNSVVDISGGNSSCYNQKTPIVLWSFGDCEYASRQFKFYSVGNGWYKICNTRSNLCLSGTSDAKVELLSYRGYASQMWKLEKADNNGYYYLRNKVSDKNGTVYYLDVENGSSGNGSRLILYPLNKGNNQKFRLTKADRTY